MWKNKIFQKYYNQWKNNYFRKRNSYRLNALKKRYFYPKKSKLTTVFNESYSFISNQPKFFITKLNKRFSSNSSSLKRLRFRCKKRKLFLFSKRGQGFNYFRDNSLNYANLVYNTNNSLFIKKQQKTKTGKASFFYNGVLLGGRSKSSLNFFDLELDFISKVSNKYIGYR